MPIRLPLHLLLVPLTVTVFAAPAALPCSPAEPSLGGTAAPVEGGTLPVNGVVHADLFTGGVTPGASVRADSDTDLVEPGSRSLDVDSAAGVFRVNLDGLEPATSYTLTLTLPPEIVFSEEEATREIPFVTARDVDDTAPTLEGDATVVVEHQPGPGPFGGFDSCGGPTETNLITVTPPAASDDVGLAGLKLYRVDDNGARELRTFRLTTADGADEGLTIGDSEKLDGAYAYEVVAVDLAGNESAPVALDVNIGVLSGCSATASDASTPAAAIAFAAVLASRRRRKLAGR